MDGRTTLLALAVITAVPGCLDGREEERGPVSPDLSGVKRTLVVRREQLAALVGDQVGIWRSVLRQERILDMFRVYEQVPVGPGKSRLESALKGLARECSFTSARVAIEDVGPPPPAVPGTVDTPGGPRFDPDEIAGTLDIRLDLEPADLGAAERFVVRMGRLGGRMIVPLHVDVTRGKVVVRARAWYFHDIEPPRAVIRVPDLDAELGMAGVDPRATRDIDTLFRIVDLVRLDGEIAVLAALAGPVAQDLARSNLLAARFDFYKRHEGLGGKVRFSDLLGD